MNIILYVPYTFIKIKRKNRLEFKLSFTHRNNKEMTKEREQGNFYNNVSERERQNSQIEKEKFRWAEWDFKAIMGGYVGRTLWKVMKRHLDQRALSVLIPRRLAIGTAVSVLKFATTEAYGECGSKREDSTTQNRSDWSEAQAGNYNTCAIMVAFLVCPPTCSWKFPSSTSCKTSVWNATSPGIFLVHFFISFRSVVKYYTLREIFSDNTI